jgi:catechol 2,3-dioxygenase-like lactoylglutathione lyase family enzyme
MLDHVSIGVSDLKRSRRFYDAALRPLGVVRANAVIARVFPPPPPSAEIEDPKLIVVIVVPRVRCRSFRCSAT